MSTRSNSVHLSIAILVCLFLTSVLGASAFAEGTSLPGLTQTESMELLYTDGFSVDCYDGGYQLITMNFDGRQLFTVPEGAEIPTDVPEGATILQLPLSNVVLSTSAGISQVAAIGGLDSVHMVSMKASSCYIEPVVERLNDGRLTTLGDELDYEYLVEHNTSLCVFNGEIDDAVAEKLDGLGIAWFLDHSNRENHPLARVEWTKLYGALLGLDDEAQAVFDENKAIVDALNFDEMSGKTAVAFFINSKGVPQVYNMGDYTCKMIEMAGGTPYPSDLGVGETGRTKMELEAFLTMCKDADYIIYTAGAMGGTPLTVQDIVDRCELIADFKAVADGNVWTSTPNYFQVADALGNMIGELNQILNGAPADTELEYFYHLD